MGNSIGDKDLWMVTKEFELEICVGAYIYYRSRETERVFFIWWKDMDWGRAVN